MKVPIDSSYHQNMDNNGLKFSDRLKALLKTESRQDVDPYIFSEPEPFAAGKGVKQTQTKNSHVTVRNNGKSRTKCITRRTRTDDTGMTMSPSRRVDICEKETRADSTTSTTPTPMRADGDDDSEHFCDTDDRTATSIVEDAAERSRDRTRRSDRDHTLLYYPRAGDEISDSESSGDELGIYQRHWFGDVAINSSQNRATRLSQLRSQLRRRLVQFHKGGHESETLLRERTHCLLDDASKKPTIGGWVGSLDERLSMNGKIPSGPLLVGGPCVTDGCRSTSLPCTRHCSRHIMLNADQLLFEHCTAKFSDNTQCCVPVFDVAHELPLCPEHARKRDNYHRKAQESKPKKSRKKPPASPTVPRPRSKSRPKKRKKPPVCKLDTKITDLMNEEMHYPSQAISVNENHTKTLNNLNVGSQCVSNSAANLNLGLGLGSLGLGGGLKVELGDHEVFASLDSAEHDFDNVLNNLPADAFNDIFIENRNGEYEPSREEEEELERALEAVDKDVRNLERMGQTHGLLEPALLAQLMSDIAS